jgi:hypothetical protein
MKYIWRVRYYLYASGKHAPVIKFNSRVLRTEFRTAGSDRDEDAASIEFLRTLCNVMLIR